MNVEKAFPSKYLKASDLGTKDQTVTIARVELGTVGQQQEQKPIVYFEGKDKGLCLNKTNSRTIAEIAESWESDAWIGVVIVLFRTQVEFSGKTVEAIRVKTPKRRAVQSDVPPPTDEDFDGVPF